MNISTEIGSNSIPSRTYQAPLIDESNAQHIISAFEVDSISDSISSVDLLNVTHIIFPEIQGEWPSIQARPTGRLDLLIGANVLGLHPVDLELRDNLIVACLVVKGSH